jgi:hypothetical protein
MNYTATIGIGDILMRPKLPCLEHIGVAIGNGLVCHNTPERGEHVSTIQEFAAGQPVKVQHTAANPLGVVSRANKILANPKKYDPVHRNCEHTTFEILHGVAKSPFVLVVISLIILGGILWLLLRR